MYLNIKITAVELETVIPVKKKNKIRSFSWVLGWGKKMELW